MGEKQAEIDKENFARGVGDSREGFDQEPGFRETVEYEKEALAIKRPWWAPRA
jgi:hypothetical protein